jgi:hypothetical protein
MTFSLAFYLMRTYTIGTLSLLILHVFDSSLLLSYVQHLTSLLLPLSYISSSNKSCTPSITITCSFPSTLYLPSPPTGTYVLRDVYQLPVLDLFLFRILLCVYLSPSNLLQQRGTLCIDSLLL